MMQSTFLVQFLVGYLQAFSSGGFSTGTGEDDVMGHSLDRMKLEPSPDGMAYVDMETRDPCCQPKNIGLCRAHFRNFYYNQTSKSCEPFDYGGCGGNANNFVTKEECNKACNKAELTKSATLPPDEACMDKIPDCANKELLCRHLLFGDVMRRVCKKTCGFCSCLESDHGLCIGLKGYCSKGHYWVDRNCNAMCGKCRQKEAHIWESPVLRR